LTAYKDKTSLAQTFQALLKQAEQKEEEREQKKLTLELKNFEDMQ